MRYRALIIIVCCIIGFITIKPILFQPFNYQVDDIQVTVVYHQESTDFEVPPFSTLGVVADLVMLGDDVDYTKLNFNQVLKDGDVIVIPIQTDEPCISINNGTVADLTQLSGIGPSLAQRIIDYRSQNGRFQEIEGIMMVKGIKEKVFAKIVDQICL